MSIASPDVCPHLDAMPAKRGCPFDPPEEYAQLRVDRPVVRVKTPRGDYAWLVTRFDDVRKALIDKRLSSDPRTPGYPTYITGEVPPPPGFFLQADAPDHTRLRKAVTQDFLNSHVKKLKPRMQEIFDEQLEYMLAQEAPVDLIKMLAIPVSAKVICELLGTPLADHAYVQRLTDIVLDRRSTPADAEAAAIELMGYFDRIVTEKEQQTGDDLLCRLIENARLEGQPSHQELVGLAALLLLGAYDTMALAMGMGVVTLINHPDQLDSFLHDETKADALVDELVRYLSINHAGLPRAAKENMEIGGQHIRAGDGVILMINSANRDIDGFENPDAFDIGRKEQHHLGFGHGIHKCLGMQFARAELSIAIRTLFTRVPSLEIAVPQSELRYRNEMVLYGLEVLPVTWDHSDVVSDYT